MSNQDLQVGDPATFLGESQSMDLSELKDKTFIVAVNSGDREKGKFICETIMGPFTFLEMVDEVNYMWQENLHHSKVYVISRDRREPPRFLDVCTCDFIEARAVDIATEAFIEGTLGEYTCKAGLVSAIDEDPRVKKEEPKEDEK